MTFNDTIRFRLQTNPIPPGDGARKYASDFLHKHRISNAIRAETIRGEDTIKRLVWARPEPNNPRVKRCAVCLYFFLDETRNRSARVCGAECRTILKTYQRAVQRSRKGASDRIELEYPVYSDEWAGSWREIPFGDCGDIGKIVAAKERYETIGGRRKPKYEVEY